VLRIPPLSPQRAPYEVAMGRAAEVVTSSTALSARLTPRGHVELMAAPSEEALPLDARAAKRITGAFGHGEGEGVLQLGLAELSTALPAELAYWRELSRALLTAACRAASLADGLALPTEELSRLASAPPPMQGGEYVTPEVLAGVWQRAAAALEEGVSEEPGGLASFLERRGPSWHAVGRVCFHLAENKQDDEAPFAFLATYAHGLGKDGRVRHLPLGNALEVYAGKALKAELVALLEPVRRAAERSALLKGLVEKGDVFHPLRFSPREAHAFLQDAPLFEEAGVVVRVPDWWSARRPPRPRVQVSLGQSAPSRLGMDALLDFRVDLAIEGERLSKKEAEALLAESGGLALVKGRWVEVDKARLEQALAHWQRAEKEARSGLSFAEGMRLLAGARLSERASDVEDAELVDEWSEVQAGKWLAGKLEDLRHPDAEAKLEREAALGTRLRPYQRAGLKWLWTLSRLGLGGLLADDMGLGKTVQVLGLLSLQRRERPKGPPHLLVLPASLVGNWEAEAARFAPHLKLLVAHPSRRPARELARLSKAEVERHDVVLTTYGTLPRLPWATERRWGIAVLDEAQAIKNPSTRQAKAVRRLQSEQRLALTGTPIENRLGDLWALFDFVNPGLLGSAASFRRFQNRLGSTSGGYEPLRRLTGPYVLRRLKTDRSIIKDLPDKTELLAHCLLSAKQAQLYEGSVEELATKLATLKGIERRGVVLAYLLRLKQICNHPSQWLGDGGYAEAESGKLRRLRALCEPISARQEKALVFTQFREMTAPLAAHLEGLFGRPGLVLHGGTPVKQRAKLVERFGEDEAAPFMVLSLKAGGTGLNLTAASHVIHFDRWWNPAVEDQATDRAFRIGQKKNVLVHKLVCRGTVEEKIDALIADKRKLARDVLGSGGEVALTELDDEQLLSLVSLDLNAALDEDGDG
jgi:superfamily II DNA or RNA helicase